MDAKVSKQDLVELGWSESLATKTLDIITQLESLTQLPETPAGLGYDDLFSLGANGVSSNQLFVEYPRSFVYPMTIDVGR
ncbi:MAG TPA: hypothetical protein PLR25_04720 [Planctomycetaceae bacterium]|nr:hypothetical protein [Planctomycetaceae bacterium]